MSDDDDHEVYLQTSDLVAARLDAIRLTAKTLAEYGEDADVRELLKRAIEAAILHIECEKPKAPLLDIKGGKK